MTNNGFETREIQTATIEQKTHRFKDFLHSIFPNHVSLPVRRNRLESGDKLILPSGKKVKVGAIVRSAEGVRYAFSNLSLPVDESISTGPEEISLPE